MKNILLVFILLFSKFRSQNSATIIDINTDNQILTFKLFNKNTYPIVLFPNARYFKYSVPLHNENHKNFPFFYTLDQNDPVVYWSNFSDEYVDRVAKDYKITKDQAILFLQYKQNPIYINPNTSKTISWKILLKKKEANKEELERKCSEFFGEIGFWIEYFPQKYKDSVRNKKNLIVNKILIPKTKVTTSKFYFSR